MLTRLLKQISPSIATDRVKITRDSMAWYKVIDGRLLVPPVPVLQANVMELDKFVEAVKAFTVRTSTDSKYDWTNLTLKTLTTASEITQLHEVLKTHSVCAVDIETKRVEWEDNKMLAIGFAWNNNHATALDWPRLGAEALDALQQLLLDPKIIFIWHNGKFDCTRLKYLANIDARIDEDTMLLHYACINERRGSHGLKDLGQLYLQAPAWDDELDRLKKEYARKNRCALKEFMYDMIPTEKLLHYMQHDCIATLRLWHLFNELKLEGTEWIYRKLIEASNVFKDVELTGFKIDMSYLEELEFNLETELSAAEKALNAEISKIWDPMRYVAETGAKSVPGKFNLRSPAQLKWLLETLTGQKLKSTNAETIDALLEEISTSNGAHSALSALRTVRRVNKQLDTYINGLRERVCTDHRVRGVFNLHGTETGRLSSSNPNMQNIPRTGPIKGLFTATSAEYCLLQLDYSQAEIRTLAHLSNDKFLIDAYRKGIDLHALMAEQVFGPSWTKEQRNVCKGIIFGTIYGRGPASIAEQFGYSMSEARAVIEKVLSYMPEARKWINEQRAKALRGEDCISIFGRRRHFVLTSHDAQNHIQNEYVNTPVQSAASDVTMCSLLAIHKWLEEENKRSKIVSTVHDSIILDVHKAELREVVDKCLTVMAAPVFLNCAVPFKADAEVGERWNQLYAYN